MLFSACLPQYRWFDEDIFDWMIERIDESTTGRYSQSSNHYQFIIHLLHCKIEIGLPTQGIAILNSRSLTGRGSTLASSTIRLIQYHGECVRSTLNNRNWTECQIHRCSHVHTTEAHFILFTLDRRVNWNIVHPHTAYILWWNHRPGISCKIWNFD